jgi:short-chain fatty acids transporter
VWLARSTSKSKPLGLLKIRARELVGYSVLQLMVLLPLVLFLMWLFARTLPYIPPQLS